MKWKRFNDDVQSTMELLRSVSGINDELEAMIDRFRSISTAIEATEPQ